MPKLKMDDDEFDVDELEGAEYEEQKRYSGPQPPKGTILTGFIKKAWWTFTNDNSSRLMKVIFEADGDTDYEGLGVWDNITFNAKSKWRWAPFLDAHGLTVSDVKNKMYVPPEDEDDDNLGTPIIKIGKWVVGEDSTACRIITTRRRDQNGDWQTNVDTWLEYEEPEDEDDDDLEDEQPPPTRRVKSAVSSKPGAAKARRTRPEPEPEEDAEDEPEEDEEELEDDEDQEEEASPETPAKRRAPAGKPTATARSARPVAATPGRRTAKSGRVAGKPVGKRRASAADDDPPF